MFFYFLKGVFLGFSLVIPLGPQNAFIFNRATLMKSFRPLIPILLVTISCDALLVLTAILGIDLLFYFPPLKTALSLIGSGFLFFMGWKTWRSSTAPSVDPNALSMSLSRQVIYTLSISLLNPHAILDTFVVIGSVTANYILLEKQLFAVGCILVDSLWFLALTACGLYASTLKNSSYIIQMINRISSLIMFYFATDLIFPFLLNFSNY